MILMQREKKILAIGLSKGYLDITTFSEHYKTMEIVRETIKRFIDLKFMTQDVGNRFKINKELIIEALSD